jgi:four helix bundle protein
MSAHCHEDLAAWRLADQLRRKIYDLFARGPASRNRRLREQAEDAASSACRNLAEGFTLFNPPDFARFARYSAASVAEVGETIQDGLARKYWSAEEVVDAQRLVKRTLTATGRLQRYLRSTRARENAKTILQRKEAGRKSKADAGTDGGRRTL